MTKKKKSKIRRVSAVGLAAMNPNFVVVFHIHSPNEGGKVFVYPPDGDDVADFKLPKQTDDSRNYVILTAPERYQELYRHAKRIHRLLICGKGQVDYLLSIGAPIIDAEMKNGKIVRSLSFKTTDELRRIIEEDAGLIKLRRDGKQPKKTTTTKSKSSPKSASATAVEVSELLPILKDIKSDFSGDGEDYQNAVLIPTILRIIRDMDRAEFKQQCKLLEEEGVSKKLCGRLYNFLEKKWEIGGGKRLSKAVRSYLDAKKPSKIGVLAKKHGVSQKDLNWVLKAVRKLEAAVAEG